MTVRKFSDQQEREMADLYRQGMSFVDIARRFGCTDVSVRNAMKRVGEPIRTIAMNRDMKALTEEDKKSICREYENGDTVKGLAKKYKKKDSEISEILDTAGVEIRTGRPKLTEDEEEVVVFRWQNGEPTAAVARAFGITAGTVTRILNRHGVKTKVGRPGFSDSPEFQVKVEALYSSGLSQHQVATSLGVSQALISRVLAKSGIKDHNNWRPRRETHGRWRGGRVLDSHGYVLVMPAKEDLPFCNTKANGYVLEHRLVMGKKIGRPLRSDESVHHKDGNRQNNDPSNLQLRQGKHGKGAVFTCGDCGSHNILADDIAD